MKTWKTKFPIFGSIRPSGPVTYMQWYIQMLIHTVFKASIEKQKQKKNTLGRMDFFIG